MLRMKSGRLWKNQDNGKKKEYARPHDEAKHEIKNIIHTVERKKRSRTSNVNCKKKYFRNSQPESKIYTSLRERDEFQNIIHKILYHPVSGTMLQCIQLEGTKNEDRWLLHAFKIVGVLPLGFLCIEILFHGLEMN